MHSLHCLGAEGFGAPIFGQVLREKAYAMLARYEYPPGEIDNVWCKRHNLRPSIACRD